MSIVQFLSIDILFYAGQLAPSLKQPSRKKIPIPVMNVPTAGLAALAVTYCLTALQTLSGAAAPTQQYSSTLQAAQGPQVVTNVLISLASRLYQHPPHPLVQLQR